MTQISITLEKGMKLKSLPEEIRPAFSPPINDCAQPEFRFRDGRFYRLTYLEWEVFEAQIPWGTTLTLDTNTWDISCPSLPLTTKSRTRMAEIAMSENYGFLRKLATINTQSLIWC